MKKLHIFCLTAALGAFLVSATGCSRMIDNAYYDMRETLGQPKRNILVNRVENAREDQVEAKEQFSSALEEFRTVLAFDGGELGEKYDTLDREYKRAKKRADEVRDNVDGIKSVAESLFNEWENELDQYQNGSLRRSSEQQLRESRNRYEDLIRAMDRVVDSMDPVLGAFQDQVLYLKHNLNAAAIASLEGELTTIEGDVQALIEEMEASIAEADAFLQNWSGGN